MALVFPTHLFNPRSIKIWLASQTVQSGQSLSGIVQAIRTDGGGIRMCQMDGIVLNRPDKLRAWKAWMAEFQGGVGRVVVPVATNVLAPRPQQANGPMPYGKLLATSDDPYFPEAKGYGLEMVSAVIATPADLRATQIDIELLQGDKIRGGETLSIEHPTEGHHIYEVNRVLSRADNVFTVKIDCPLREAVTSEAVNFDWPMFDAYMMPELDIAPMVENKRAEVSITFREAF